MKLNNKGFAISSVMYLILVMALLLVALLLGLLNSRKLILDRQKKDIIDSFAIEEIESLTIYPFSFKGNYDTFTVPQTGLYKIELWGAQGGGTYGGKGAYTSGLINLNRGDALYVYVGGQANTFNGGGNCSSASKIGGGATDVRLVSGNWNSISSLTSRIMVAAGGGTVTNEDSGAKAGIGGTINGINGSYHSATDITYIGYGGTQTAGGSGATNANQTGATSGTFGTGGTCGAYTPDGHIGGGGGGGFYGGGGSSWHTGSGGGSSFVSGYIDCNAVTPSSSSITHIGTPIVTYNGNNYIFSNPEMIAGNASMPTHDGSSTMIGNSGDGYAKITFISGNVNQSQDQYSYEYTGNEQVLRIPKSGYYKLETWGAQGGEGLCNEKHCHDHNSSLSNAIGGYGGYSMGIVRLNKDDRLYINVGGKGSDGVLEGCQTVNNSKTCTGKNSPGGYNGGGTGSWDGTDDEVGGAGGGATHIATKSGLLYTLKLNSLLIVSGGGGGGSWGKQGGSGGGIAGGASGMGDVATQTSGYQFGKGEDAEGIGASDGHGGGGGGLYGGYESTAVKNTPSVGNKEFGGGGSGYIGNNLLLSSSSSAKHMTCYSCTTSTETATKTNSVTTSSSTPVADMPKEGNGYAKITYLGTSIN